MRRALIAAPLVLFALALAPAPDSGAADTFGLTPDRRFTRLMPKLADACFECGDIAKGLGLYSYTRSYFNHALQYDADHRATRRVMGFKKKRGEWVLEEDLVPKGDEIIETRRAELESKLVERTEPVRRKAADEIWKLVADKTLAHEQRMLALYHLLRICPEHRDAQKAARCHPAGYWYAHVLDDEGETLRERWIQTAPAGEAIAETTPYEKKTGLKMAKHRTPWVVVHAHLGEKSVEWAGMLARFAEAARARAMEIAGLPGGSAPTTDEHRLHISVFREREHYAAFVEKCSGISDERRRAETANNGYGSEVFSPYGAVFLYPQTDNDYGLRDAIAHDLAVKTIRACTDWGAYWLVRGFGYLNSTQMNGSVESRFFLPRSSAVIDSGGREALPGLGKCASTWRLEIAMEYAANSALSLNKLVAVRPADYREREVAHSFVFTEFVLANHREKLTNFLKAAREERMARAREEKPLLTGAELLERMLKELGLTEDEFNQGCRAWVLENYVRPPQE